MTTVLALIQPFRLVDVTRTLETVPVFTGMSTGMEVRAMVSDLQVDAAVHAIATAAHIGRGGHGVIAVLPIERLLRLEEGTEAV